MKSRELLRAHPASTAIDEDALVECIEMCYECAQACTACADACLGQDADLNVTGCIRTCLDCADICQVTGRILTRLARPAPTIQRGQVSACMNVCRVCAEQCRRNDDNPSCEICADSCERCQRACEVVLNAFQNLTVA